MAHNTDIILSLCTMGVLYSMGYRSAQNLECRGALYCGRRCTFMAFGLPLLVIALFGYPRQAASAQSTPLPLSQESHITICSQNLANYGDPEDVRERVKGESAEAFRQRESLLVQRMTESVCDLVAVQEVVGSNQDRAFRGLGRLATILGRSQGRVFMPIVGGANSGDVRVGFLVASSVLSVESASSYAGRLLPSLDTDDRPVRLSRGPLVVQLRHRGHRLTVVNFHLKSKYGGSRDSAKLQFETLRMQMAQHTRSLVEGHYLGELLSPDEWVIMLGDRNSRRGSASDQILRGERSLIQFDQAAGCIVTRWGEAICPRGTAPNTPLFLSALSGRIFLGRPDEGTFRFRSSPEWIDDILLARWSLLGALYRGEIPHARVNWNPLGASDHAMVVLTIPFKD